MTDIERALLWSTTTTEGRMTGTWRLASPDYRNIPSPCLGACPVNGQIATWIRQVKEKDYHGAWITLIENNPFPAIAGRICHHPCETACNRAEHDEAISICALERFVGDMALAEGWQFSIPESKTGQSVAVVGGGPAGLSAAYQLARRGFDVVLYEAHEQLGGLLRYGIPAYRLDKAIVDSEIARIVNLGVTVKLSADVSDAGALKALRAEHDAVFLATGATRSKSLPELDYNHDWVMDSAEFLAATNADESCDLGQRLVVIGGGSAGIDVARTARRLGREVTILALEPDELLPAQRGEVIEASEEGIEFVCGAMMQSVEESKRGLKLACQRVDYKQGKIRSEFNIIPIEGSEFTLEADAVIPSIGQDADLAKYGDLLASAGPVVKTDNDWQTSNPGIFAGGDIASMDRFVTQAVGMGKQAAGAIARYVDPSQSAAASGDDPEAPFSVINIAYHSEEGRNVPGNMEVDKRLGSFQEVQQRLGTNEALSEAGRCFSCGTCIYCDNCYFYCPDMAITRFEKGYEVNTDYCKGCGLCVAECPTGAIKMHEELG